MKDFLEFIGFIAIAFLVLWGISKLFPSTEDLSMDLEEKTEELKSKSIDAENLTEDLHEVLLRMREIKDCLSVGDTLRAKDIADSVTDLYYHRYAIINGIVFDTWAEIVCNTDSSLRAIRLDLDKNIAETIYPKSGRSKFEYE
jgi:hypothetical protein